MNKLLARIDKRYAKVCLYAGVTVVLTLVAAMLVITISPVFNKVWHLICTVGEPLVYGAAISYVLNPLATRISHQLSRSKRYAGPEHSVKRRTAAVLYSVLLVLLGLLAILTVLVLMVTHSVSSLRPEAIQDLLGAAGSDFSEMLAAAEGLLEEWGVMRANSDFDPLSLINGAKNLATTIVFAVIFSVYFLIDGPRVAAYGTRVFRALLGEHSTIDYGRLFADADKVFSGYFRGQATDAVIVGVLSGIVLTAIGVPFGPVIGLLTGLGNMIPYVGGPVGFGAIALMCLPGGQWTKMALGFAALAVVMFVDANIINPKLLSDNVEVHPILVMVALIAGGAVGGLAGMLVAVPAAAFIKIQLDRWVERREAAD